MAAIQDKNWVIIQEQLAFNEQNFHILRDCYQLLFANQQYNFNFDTVSSLLSMIHASVKSYRPALFVFRMNFFEFDSCFAYRTFADVAYSNGVASSDHG